MIYYTEQQKHLKVMKRQKFLLIVTTIFIASILCATIIFVNTKTLAEASGFTEIDIGRINDNLNYLPIPITHVDPASLNALKTNATQFLTEADNDYAASNSIHAIKSVITETDATELIQNLPFYHDSRTDSQSDIYITIIEVSGKHYGIKINIPKSNNLQVNSNKTRELSEMGILEMTREQGERHNPNLPTQHIDVNSLNTNNPVIHYMTGVNKYYHPYDTYNSALRFAIDKTSAIEILHTIPFKYHNSKTQPGYDMYSTIMEVDGKYYFVILGVPK